MRNKKEIYLINLGSFPHNICTTHKMRHIIMQAEGQIIPNEKIIDEDTTLVYFLHQSIVLYNHRYLKAIIHELPSR